MLTYSYAGLILFIILLELVRKKTNIFDFFTFFNIMFSLMLLLPAFIFSTNLLEENYENNMYMKLNVNDVQIVLALFIGYFAVLIGFYSQSSQRYSKILKIYFYDEKIIFKIALFLFFLSALSVQGYTSQFGGIISALSQSTFIRMNIAEGARPLSFLQHFTFLSYFSSYLFMSLIKSKLTKKKILLTYILFILSAINAIITVMVTAGRANLIYYFLIFYIAYIISDKNTQLLSVANFLITVMFVFLGFLLTLYGKTFFFSLSSINSGIGDFIESLFRNIDNQPSESSVLKELINNFSYPLYSLQAALHKDYLLRLFSDWIYGIISFLPERILHITVPETISTINSELISGTKEYTIPTGMFAFGIYSLSWPGLIIVCYTYGWFGRFFEMTIYQHIHSTTWMPFLYAITSKVWIDFFTAGDPGIFLFTVFWALIGNLILLTIGSKIRISKLNLALVENQLSKKT